MNAASCPPSSCVPSGAVASRKVVFQNNDRRHHLPPGIDRYFGYIETCEAAGMLPEDKSELAEIPLKHGLDGVATVVTFLELFKADNADGEQEVRHVCSLAEVQPFPV
ncbi:hypothetical protein AAVH_08759 [Aphelenchoides avenae]|nr:hypothetical protein AAVH_08759 [Aphelenchus avenae]